MKMNIKKLLIRFSIVLFLFNISVVNLFSQGVTKVGTTSAKFLTIPTGARAVGMGGAFVSVANDPSALFWNSAGIINLEKPEIYISHTEWIAEINYDYSAFVYPMGDVGTLGLSLSSMTMPSMELTTETFPEGTGETFDANSFALGISYARKLTEWFSVGVTGKFINEKIYNSNANGFAIDIGTLFVTPFDDIRLGVNISNFGQKLQMQGEDLLVQKDIDETQYGNNESVNAYLATDKFDLPLTLRIGISGELLKTDDSYLTWAIDAAHPNDNSEYVNIGFEYSLFNKMIQIRGGKQSLFRNGSDDKFVFGFGSTQNVVNLFNLSMDYTMESHTYLSTIHRIGFSVQL
ncbi:MAG: PorV/PorQ family protein [Ignavibacteria bacterium]|nr:PorV/PorQ family protein [Bacteroidota bacterium]MSQ46207.1 PorV/PorQ family protein [Ignavibacteria bacterium]